MLSDGMLRGLKPRAAAYKVADRDGMYVTVSPKGTITFRLDYRLNGRRETLTVGRYGAKDGISLLMARERCTEARKAIAAGLSPSQEKQREKRRMSEAKTFGEFTNRWLEEGRMAETTKSMRKSIIDRDIMPVFRNRLMAEIGAEDLRNLCAKVKARGAPAT
ncbi:MAG: integrase arm-type DNA-binding domain-containing protein, partial [Burkholderiaceae bacterium]|nr:integrase arm-type DNA-binding domain-containing protein [Burkholderiaceae bacterium]